MGRLLIDPSGVYFRPEGAQFICGVSPPEDRDPDVAADDLVVDHSLFEEIIWPALAHRVRAFEAVKVTASWAGHYAFNTFDHNAVLGPHPAVANFYLANGFSGHGLQQSPAVGRAIAEQIASSDRSTYATLDLAVFGFDRILEGRPVVEKCVV